MASDNNYKEKTSEPVKLTIKKVKKAKKGLMDYLKGTWGTAHRTTDKSGKNVHWSYVKFTKKYAKYYRKENGKLIYVEKYKIVSTKKLKNKKGKLSGYLIKMKKGKSKKSYRLYLKEPNILHYFGSWSTKKYSGSSSLELCGNR